MSELSIPQKLIRPTQMCRDRSRSRVRIGNWESEVLDLNNGLKQGDALSPLMFNILLENAIRSAGITMKMFPRNYLRSQMVWTWWVDRSLRLKNTLSAATRTKHKLVCFEAYTQRLGGPGCDNR